MDISLRIRELRKRCGLNQFELADAINVSVDSVRRWESNKQFPRADELVQLSSALNVSVDELLNGPDDGEVKITLVYDWDKMKEGKIDMEDNGFELILGSNGKVGLHGAGMITSRDAIEDFLAKVREQLEIALDAQVRRGAVQG